MYRRSLRFCSDVFTCNISPSPSIIQYLTENINPPFQYKPTFQILNHDSTSAPDWLKAIFALSCISCSVFLCWSLSVYDRVHFYLLLLLYKMNYTSHWLNVNFIDTVPNTSSTPRTFYSYFVILYLVWKFSVLQYMFNSNYLYHTSIPSWQDWYYQMSSWHACLVDKMSCWPHA